MEISSCKEAGWLDLKSRVCVVTGAGSGIGASTAQTFAAIGAHVAVLDRNQENAELVVRCIQEEGGVAIAITADVSDSISIKSAALKVRETLGNCEILVNNAAVQHVAPLLELEQENWNASLAVNLTGAFLCAQTFSAQMIDRGKGGCIINVASICAEHPRPNGGAYSVSKAGLVMLSQQLAVELAGYNIRCNAISPGMIRTPLSENTYRNSDFAKRRSDMVPSGRIGDPDDIANTIMFLASDRSNYINGQALLVDGGLSRVLMNLTPRL